MWHRRGDGEEKGRQEDVLTGPKPQPRWVRLGGAECPRASDRADLPAVEIERRYRAALAAVRAVEPEVALEKVATLQIPALTGRLLLRPQLHRQSSVLYVQFLRELQEKHWPVSWEPRNRYLAGMKMHSEQSGTVVHYV